MLLYSVFTRKMRDVGWRLIFAAAALGRGVDEVSDAVCEGAVDERFALDFLVFETVVFADEGLDAEDAVEVWVRGFGFCEEGGDVI